MLLSKFVKVRITSSTYKYYRELGYTEKCNSFIVVPIEQLPLGSNVRVDVKCDNCGCEYTLHYCDYNKVKGPLYCRNCKSIKTKQTNIKKYGCENVFQVASIREKQHKTIQDKYGCDNVFQNDDVKKKIVATMEEKYGVSHLMHVKEIAESVIEHRNETMYANGTCICSRQQRHLHDIIGGELNKLYGSLWLDIYFEEEKVYAEWDGSGHDLCVKYGKMTEEAFKEREIKRHQFLKSCGLKELRIICASDIMPDDDVLKSIKEFGLQVLKRRNHIVFDTDNNIISFVGCCIPYDFKTPIKYNLENNTIVTTVGENIYYIDKDTV